MTYFAKKAPGNSLLDLVAKGEGVSIEFKRLVHSAPKIARSIVIDEAVRYHVEPKPRLDVRFEEFKRRMVLLIEVPQSPERPHFHIERVIRRDTGKRTVERRVFTRNGSHNKAANDDQIALMLSSREPVKLSFTDREKRLLDYLDSHERITANEFAENACIPMREARRILVSLVRSGALRLITEGRHSSYALAAS